MPTFILIVLVLFLLTPFVVSSPLEDIFGKITGHTSGDLSISFDSNTPEDESIQTGNSISVSVSSSSSSKSSVFLDFQDSLQEWNSMEGDAEGIRGDAEGFEGTGDVMILGTSDFGLAETNEMTVSLWFNIKGGDTTGYFKVPLIKRGKYVYPFSIEFQMNLPYHPSKTWIESKIRTGEDQLIFGGSDSGEKTYNFNEWYHVVLTFEEGVGKYYINGDLIQTQTSSSAGLGFGSDRTSNKMTSVGGWYEDTTKSFNGSIDEVMIFNRALSSGEIASLYDSTLHSYSRNFNELVPNVYSFKAYIIDEDGNVKETETRFVKICSQDDSECLNIPVEGEEKIITVCGDTFCEVGESFETCPADCAEGEVPKEIPENMTTTSETCEILSAYWNKTIVREGTQSTLVVKGKNCNKQLVNFQLYEEDLPVEGGTNQSIANLSGIFIGDYCVVNWISLFHNDCDGSCLPSEYAFSAMLVGDTTKKIISSNRLDVRKFSDNKIFETNFESGTDKGSSGTDLDEEEFGYNCTDSDKDGFNELGEYCGIADCDDNNPLVYPGALELCNGVDDNCDGVVDPNCEGIAPCKITNIFLDSDGNLPGSPLSVVVEGENCDDYKLFYKVYEDDFFLFGDELVDSFVSDFNTAWKIKYVDDIFGDPEYYIEIYLANGEKVTDTHRISVSKVPKDKLPVADSFDGNTTDFERVGVYNLSHIVLEKQGLGKIEISSDKDIDLEKEDLDDHVIIEENLIGIDSENLPELDVPAILTLYGINIIDPIIFEDGKPCEDCEILSYENETLEFSVKHFSNYSAVDSGTIHYVRADATGTGCGRARDPAV